MMDKEDFENNDFFSYVDSDDPEDTDIEVENKVSLTNNGSCCKNKCLSVFDDEFKSRLKSDLSQLSRLEKQIYLFAMISINEKKKIHNTCITAKHFQYTVKEYGVSRSVCKKAFIIIHNTTTSHVRTLCQKMRINQLIPMDQRGRHDKRPTIPEQTKVLIKSHFYQILESPSIFKCAKKRLGQPNFHQLWLDFVQKNGHLSRATYMKYIKSFLTPDILTKFMCANEAKQILLAVRKYDYGVE